MPHNISFIGLILFIIVAGFLLLFIVIPGVYVIIQSALEVYADMFKKKKE